MPDIDSQIEEISDALSFALVGKDKALTVIAALSIAATTAYMIGMGKLELQQILIRCYDKRVKEAAQ